MKVRTIEALDQRIIKPIVDCTAAMTEPVTIALLPDHATPCAVRTHTRDAVPFLICRPGEKPDGIAEFNEETAKPRQLRPAARRRVHEGLAASEHRLSGEEFPPKGINSSR